MKLITGLGNPGKEYEKTRHNAGFLVIDRVLKELSLTLDREKFRGAYTVAWHNGEKVIFLKPLTYMNDSGSCVREIMDYYDIDHDDLFVIHDDLDLPLGTLRLRKQGSSGGQKGMDSILTHLDDKKIKRMRIGISHDRKIDTKDYVLGRFHDEEEKEFEEVLDKAKDAILYYLDHSFEETMNLFNTKKEKKPETEETEKNEK